MQDTLLQPPSTNRRLSSLILPIMHLIGNYKMDECGLSVATGMVFFAKNTCFQNRVFFIKHKSR